MIHLTNEAAAKVREALEADCGGRCNAEYNPCAAREALALLDAAEAAPNCDTPNYCRSVQRCTAMDEHRAAQDGQKPVAYRGWFDEDNGARWLFTLWPEEERLSIDWQPLYAAPVAAPVQPAPATKRDLFRCTCGHPEITGIVHRMASACGPINAHLQTGTGGYTAYD